MFPQVGLRQISKKLEKFPGKWNEETEKRTEQTAEQLTAS